MDIPGNIFHQVIHDIRSCIEMEGYSKGVLKRLHLGCGGHYLKGYYHVDIQAHSHVDKVCDMQKIHEEFDKESVDEIYSCHTLEHCKRNNIVQTLLRWNYVLKIGGCLRIAVPDIESMMQHYLETSRLEDVIGLLYGGQRDQWGVHRVGFDLRTMKYLLEMCGFCDVKRYNALEFLPEDSDDYSLSCTPHMQQNAQLLSLNVVCYKEKSVETILPEQRSDMMKKILGFHSEDESVYTV